MDYKTLFKNTILSLIVISVLCIIAIGFTNFLIISSSLKEAIIAEIVGSGILGGIVSSVFFYLQELTSFQSNVNKSKFLTSKIQLDIKEANERGASYWNLSGGIKFYFDFSLINNLYDIYEKHYAAIEEFSTYIGNDKLIKQFSKIYLKTREGYVFGEKIDNILRQIVREVHHKNGLIAANDFPMIAYLKAKLITEIPDEGIIKHVGWSTVSGRALELLKHVKSDKNVMKLINDIITLRLELIKEIEVLNKITKSKT